MVDKILLLKEYFLNTKKEQILEILMFPVAEVNKEKDLMNNKRNKGRNRPYSEDWKAFLCK